LVVLVLLGAIALGSAAALRAAADAEASPQSKPSAVASATHSVE
jgi:hypothetical protein